MAVDMFLGGTEWFANEITLLRGTVADITAVGIYHNINPNTVPAIADFITVTLEDGTGPLADAGKIDIMSRIGAKAGAHWNPTVAGDYQRWALIQTADEDIIRKLDTVTIL
jgi:hypothetical protein